LATAEKKQGGAETEAVAVGVRSVNRAKFRHYHREVAEALTAIGNPAYGQAIQQDRGSQLKHLGITFPDLRRRVRHGFSFSTLPENQVLEVWDALWKTSPYGDVLFAALEFYAPVVRKRVSPGLWPVMRQWSDRVDNWCHSDGLSALYSRILESRLEEVYPQIASWNSAESEWLRRISLVSLIHYSGSNAVFLPVKRVLPLVSNCLDDPRYYVQTAVGWVLREMGHVYSNEITKYLETNAPMISTLAFSRAIERRSAEQRTRLRDIRKRRLA
jgi:3-methyladenine DNA glycosylase AlkD